jgi:2-polyprenyl-3-methyl-5-hydroxy-6-metoxy-1,4-benzoquinol methylase
VDGLLDLGGKPSGYFEQDRAELIRLLRPPLGRVLDVGCAGGGTAGPLRAAGAERLVGIELDPEAAERARAVFDAVHVGRAEEALRELEERFDTILCYDVLEHLVDPAALLRDLAGVAAPGARLHVSIPNARHWTLVRDLVIRGTFGYGEAGHRDKTHLRWLTPRDLVALLEGTGWPVTALEHGELRPLSRLLSRLTRGLSAGFLAYQLAALAQRPS